MNPPTLESHDFIASFLAIIEEAQQILTHHACHGIATAWLPLSQSLKTFHGSIPALLPQAAPSKFAPAIIPPKLTPSSSFHEKSPSLLSEVEPLAVSSQPKASFTLLQTPSAEPLTSSTSSESKTARKIGKWTLQPPPDVSINTQEIYEWLKKRGLSDQNPEKPRLVASKKMALFPVMILYNPASPHLTYLQRLCQAIDEKLNSCTLVKEEPELFQFLYEALERGRIDVLLCDPHLPLPKDSSLHPKLLPLDPLDLTENKRKIDIWKKLMVLLGQNT